MKKNISGPITGSELEKFRQDYGFSVIQVCAVLGISSATRWRQMVNDELPVHPATIALMVRLYRVFPDLLPKYNQIGAEDLYDLMNNIGDEELSKRRFSLLLGRDVSAYSRWSTQDQTTDQMVSQLVQMVYSIIHVNRGSFEEYIELVMEEARSRGIENIYSNERWDK